MKKMNIHVLVLNLVLVLASSSVMADTKMCGVDSPSARCGAIGCTRQHQRKNSVDPLSKTRMPSYRHLIDDKKKPESFG